jgi:steroid delta-isomerase-like uncharacterized protein
MPTAESRELARRFTEECWDQSDVAVLDALMAPDFLDHDPVPGQAPGREGYKQMAASFFGAFSNFRVRNEDVIAEGDKAVLRWTARGRHTAPLMGIPATGRDVTLRGIDVIRVERGRIVERWGEFDTYGMLQQLGVIPAAETPA